MFNHAKNRNTKKEFEDFNITVEWIENKLLIGKCEITGINFNIEKQSEYRVHPYFPSLDKKDPKKGYSTDNTIIVVFIYNLIKNEYTDLLVLDFCKFVANDVCMKH